MKLFGLGLLIASLSTGCLWANAKSDEMYGYGARAMLAGDGHLDGVTMDAQAGAAGLYIGVTGSVHDLARPEDLQTSTALGLNLDLRGSLFGILGATHELERYLDLGGEAGCGGVVGLDSQHASKPLAAGAGYYGAWVELGTLPIGPKSYLAIVGDVRREGYGAPWSDQTQLTVGLAWRERGRYVPLRGHD